MPAYNHENYVGKAIDSVLQQTYQNFEFIIVNDGSSDGTGSVIKKYNDEKIIYLTQENRGAHNALNRGILNAQGKYISIINSDDIYHPERLSFLVDSAEKNKALFLFTDVEFINEYNEKTEEMTKWLKGMQDRFENQSLTETFLAGNMALSSSNFFFSADIVKDIGLFNSYRYVHDYDFILRILSKYSDKICYISDKKYLFYRIHEKNTILEDNLKVNFETIKLLLNRTTDFVNDENDRKSIRVILKQFEMVVNNIDLTKSLSWKITSPLRVDLLQIITQSII